MTPLFLLSLLSLLSITKSTTLTVPLPLRGWNSWNAHQCNISSSLIRSTASSISSNPSLLNIYKYVIVDDCWLSGSRDPSTSRQVPDPERFPEGMKALGSYLHSLSLRLGIYTSVGRTTCEGLPASYGHYDIDARAYVEWGVDYLKIDTCGLTAGQMWDPEPHYRRMSQSLETASRERRHGEESSGESKPPFIYSLCNWGIWSPWEWGGKIAHSWRITMDIFPVWWRVMQIVDYGEPLGKFVREGGFNDWDMMEIGVRGR